MKIMRLIPALLLAIAFLSPSLGTRAAATSVQSSDPVFSPVVSQAMQYVKARSDMALVAPTFAGNGNGEIGKYLAATAQASADTYQVNLQLSTTPVVLNSPVLSQPANTGLADIIGGFGAKEYGSDAESLAQVSVNPASSPSSQITGYLDARELHLKPARIGLGLGLWGTAYTGQAIAIVEWREGEWFFQVQDLALPFAKRTAMQLVRYLHSHLLPETHGLMTVVDAGDGQHTNLFYAAGSIVYDDWDYHHALSAAKMAVSMAPYVGKPELTFPPSLSRVLTSLQETGSVRVPLYSPMDFLMTPQSLSQLQIQTQVQKDQYTITLYRNDVQNGIYNPVVTFGAQYYSGHPTALQYIEQMSQPPTFAGMTSRAIALGNGMTGTLYSDLGIVRWHEGWWSFDVEAGSAKSDITLAARIVAYLHHYLLPETHGLMWVKNTPAGQFSHLYWTFGHVVYNVYSVRRALQALHMAVSAQTY